MFYSEKISRQQFLKAGALATSAALLSKADLFAKAPANPGLQLYTLRAEMGKDPDGTLKKVAEIGYKEVESFGYADGKFFGKTPKDYAKFLKDLGLSTPSGHYNSGLFKDAKDTKSQSDVWKRAVEDAAVAGQKYMVWAYLFPQERTKIDDYKRHIELFNRSAEACKASGIQFAYHNHDFEFKELDGQMPYDMILKQTDAKLVKLELDIYWAAFAGKDPVELFKQDPGRYPLWHVKDMAKTEKREFAEVGTGSIDFQRIFDARKTAGMTHYFVEQDVCKNPPLEAIAISYRNLQKITV